MENIVRKQRDFFNSNQTKSISYRKAQLQKLLTLLKQNEKAMIDAIALDFQKSEFDLFSTELGLVYSDIKVALKKVKKWSKHKRVRTNMINMPGKSYIIPEPLGVSLVIGAWNYPFQLSFAPVVAAMAAGNSVVLKPSELPINTSHVMAKIVNENFDPNYFVVVEGGVEETTSLLNQQFDKIFFTGSVPVGKIVYAAAAKNLTPVTLELGGKSPAFVTENCNLKVTAKRLVWGKFINAGQTCIAPDYLYLHHSIKDELLELMRQELERANYSFENSNYVQIVNHRNMDRLLPLIDENKLFYGGGFDRETRFIEPTILTNISWDDKIMEYEIFGPILPVLTYSNLNDAIAEIKRRPKPLACYVFTKDKKQKQKILSEISFGGGAVNDTIMHVSNDNMPFGGVGNSGMSSYHGKFGFDAFTHYKSIFEKPFFGEPSLKYSPYTQTKLRWIKRIMG